MQRTYKIRDAATGEMKEYHSLDEVPAEYREKISQAMKQGTIRSSARRSLRQHVQLRIVGAQLVQKRQ